MSEGLLRSLWERLLNNDLSLPTLPDLALRMRQLADDPDVDAQRLAAEIRKDPAIAVQVVRMANTAAFRGAASVNQLQAAIARIGLDATRNLVCGLVLKQTFASQSPVLQSRLWTAWSRSVEVAAVARLLSWRYMVLEPEVALLAGLVHRIGALPVIRLIESSPQLLQSPQAIDDVIEKLRRRAGQLLLSTWSFPLALIPVPDQCEDFARQHGGPADYVDLVSVAILALEVRHEGIHARIDRGTVPAYAKLGIDPALDVFALDGFEARFRELMGSLAA